MEQTELSTLFVPLLLTFVSIIMDHSPRGCDLCSHGISTVGGPSTRGNISCEGTDLPCYILWPIRTENHSFWCLDAWKGDWVQLDKCGFIASVGIEHFFDAFCFNPQRPWRTAASQALGIPSCHIAEDTHIKQLEENKFTLTPRRIPAEPQRKAGPMWSWMLERKVDPVLRVVGGV